jgi:hypothetical protein
MNENFKTKKWKFCLCLPLNGKCFFCSRKKSAKSSKEDKHATAETPEPGTLIAADGTDAGISGLLQENNNADVKGKKKKKGKGKKKKMTKSEKDVVRKEFCFIGYLLQDYCFKWFIFKK